MLKFVNSNKDSEIIQRLANFYKIESQNEGKVYPHH